MIRKEYQKPEIKVITIHHEQSILYVSGGNSLGESPNGDYAEGTDEII